MNRWAVASIALFVLSLDCAATDTPELRAGVFKPPRQAPDFVLRGTDGTDFKLSRYRGKVVALSFGYSNCPGVCPTTLAYLAQARRELGAAGKELQIVYVTVDPERDDVKTLAKFVTSFDPSFVGATGTPKQLADVRKEYGITVSDKIFTNPQSKSTYFLDHSSFVYLIDRGGALRGMMPFGVTPDDIEHDAKALLGK